MGDKIRILLAEDDPLIRSLNKVLLERTNQMQVVGMAEDGEETLEMATKLRPDVVLLDLCMPGKDGMWALPRIRKQLPQARIIVVSMLQRGGIEEECLREGAVAFIDKGYDSEDFVQQVLRLSTDPEMPTLPVQVKNPF